MNQNGKCMKHARLGPHSMGGVTMIEVLVSVVILAFGLLGIASMQMLALRNSQASLERSQATMKTYAIMDAMRANRAVARIGGYNLGAMTCEVPEVAASLASKDLNAWMGSLKQSLGASACAQIDCKGEDCLIKISWDETRGKSTAATEIATSTRL